MEKLRKLACQNGDKQKKDSLGNLGSDQTVCECSIVAKSFQIPALSVTSVFSK